MILKTKNNDNFKLTMKLEINYNLEYIEILVILDNLQNNKRQMKIFKANDFTAALTQYKQWEQFIF